MENNTTMLTFVCAPLENCIMTSQKMMKMMKRHIRARKRDLLMLPVRHEPTKTLESSEEEGKFIIYSRLS